MSAEQLKAFYRRYIDQVWVQHRIDGLEQFFTQDHLDHDLPDDQGRGLDHLRATMGYMQAAFPDERVSIEEMFVDTETLIVRLTFTGTQQGEFFGIPPSGRRVEIGQIHIVRFRDGKMAEHWSRSDDLLMMRQLGAIPEPVATDARG
jgi:steroid delta-isomerase-like uncharacterized protein